MTELPAQAPLKKRPLSPHLQVYKPQLTTVLSITHRITGIALSAGLLLFVWWLVALMQGLQAFGQLQALLRAPLGLAVLVGWTWALFYHFANGIRHLAWDAGFGFSLPDTYRSGWAVVILSFVLTALTWAIGWGVL
jgi:succinate dehydrogenase / fumarate reductase cytochrome b subunit